VPAASLLFSKLAVADEERLRSWIFAVPRHVLGALALVTGAVASSVALAAAFGADGALVSEFGWWAKARDELGTPLIVLGAALGFVIAASGLRAMRTKSPQDAFGRLLGAGVAGTILCAGVVLPAVDPLKSPRDIYEDVAASVGPAPIVRYGVDDYAGHWIMKRDRIPYVDKAPGAARFLAREKGPAFVVAERTTIDEKGMPDGAHVVREYPLPFGCDILLLSRGLQGR